MHVMFMTYAQYTIPQGGYFVMVNTAKVKMPEDYEVPEYVTKGRAKDFAMAYWLTKEIGVVAMYLRKSES